VEVNGNGKHASLSQYRNNCAHKKFKLKAPGDRSAAIDHKIKQ